MRLLPTFITSLFLAAALFSFAPKAHAEEAKSFLVEKSKRPKSPKFSHKSIDGKRHKLKKMKGDVVVLNFWATWCAPCLQELPYLAAFQKKYKKKGFTVLAVSNDGPETASKVRTVAKRKKLTMPVFHDTSGEIVAKHNPRGANPFTVFIDKNGRIAYTHEGYAPGDEKKYEKLIEELLAE